MSSKIVAAKTVGVNVDQKPERPSQAPLVYHAQNKVIYENVPFNLTTSP